MARTTRAPRKRDWAVDFLAALEERVTVEAACREIGIERSTAYRRRQRDEEFALAWHDVDEATTQRMEREAFRRAVDGFKSDVLYKGSVVGSETKYSDTLLIFLLKARRPEKYRENVRIEHGGTIGVDLSSSSDDELLRVARGILDRADEA